MINPFQFTPLREGRQKCCTNWQGAHDFNSRPSARGDVHITPASWFSSISIHAPPRGATIKSVSAFISFLFQFTPLREGRLKPFRKALDGYAFQFTPLREGRPCAAYMTELIIYFNSRPSARGDCMGIMCSISPRPISIHAPPRGATQSEITTISKLLISIHAPPRGATRFARQRGQALHISIHAPPRGATRQKRYKVAVHPFQFTPLREGRLHGYSSSGGLFDFNSRPSARGDARGSYDGMYRDISIHAPPRGATRCPRSIQGSRGISIHAPPRGATSCTALHGGAFFYFNSRPSARGDSIRAGCTSSASAFQFTPLREGRRGCFSSEQKSKRFQFTPLREGRRETQIFLVKTLKFQFTPLREGRRHEYQLWSLVQYFNSRPSARGDGRAQEEGGNAG